MMAEANETWLHSHRGQRDGKFHELHRVYSPEAQLLFTARTERFGKPIDVYRGEDDGQAMVSIRNAKNYLVNGRTEIRSMADSQLLGSYTRLSRILDGQGDKIGRWRDARSWGKEFKMNLFDALANLVLGSGDVPTGADPSDTHVLSSGKNILATLQRQRLPFFLEKPKTETPGKLSRLAGKVIPGELGRGLREHLPPFAWRLTRVEDSPAIEDDLLFICQAIVRVEYMRWSRSG